MARQVVKMTKEQRLAARERLIAQHEAKYRGRPNEFDERLAQVILDRMRDGETLSGICESDEAFPHRNTVLRWRDAQSGPAKDFDFCGKYARARLSGIERRAEELFEIADGCEAAAAEEYDAIMDDADPDDKTRYQRARKAYRDEVESRRLRIDVRKFSAVKLLSEYREKVSVDHSGEVKGGIVLIPAGLDPSSWEAAALGTKAEPEK